MSKYSIGLLMHDKCLLQYEDWFFLRQMSKNVDSETFGNFLEILNKEEGYSPRDNNNS